MYVLFFLIKNNTLPRCRWGLFKTK